MAPDYYNGYGGGPSGKRRRSLVMRLVDLALTLVTLAVGATMVLTYFVPYYCVWTIIEILSNSLRGAGDAVRPMVITKTAAPSTP